MLWMSPLLYLAKVEGKNWAGPCAPAGEPAMRSNCDSAWIWAATVDSGSPATLAAFLMGSLYSSGTLMVFPVFSSVVFTVVALQGMAVASWGSCQRVPTPRKNAIADPIAMVLVVVLPILVFPPFSGFESLVLLKNDLCFNNTIVVFWHND